jgi:hypothetical protein
MCEAWRTEHTRTYIYNPRQPQYASLLNHICPCVKLEPWSICVHTHISLMIIFPRVLQYRGKFCIDVPNVLELLWMYLLDSTNQRLGNLVVSEGHGYKSFSNRLSCSKYQNSYKMYCALAQGFITCPVLGTFLSRWFFFTFVDINPEKYIMILHENI